MDCLVGSRLSTQIFHSHLTSTFLFVHANFFPTPNESNFTDEIVCSPWQEMQGALYLQPGAISRLELCSVERVWKVNFVFKRYCIECLKEHLINSLNQPKVYLPPICEPDPIFVCSTKMGVDIFFFLYSRKTSQDKHSSITRDYIYDRMDTKLMGGYNKLALLTP